MWKLLVFWCFKCPCYIDLIWKGLIFPVLILKSNSTDVGVLRAWPAYLTTRAARMERSQFQEFLGFLTCIIKFYVSSPFHHFFLFNFFLSFAAPVFLCPSLFLPCLKKQSSPYAMNEQHLFPLILHVSEWNQKLKCWVSNVEELGSVADWILKTVKQYNFNLHFLGSEFTV